MKKVSLTPSNLYELYCKYFNIPHDATENNPSEIYRYGMRVPNDLKKLLQPEHRRFLWQFMREKLFLNDLPDDDKYVYKGPEAIFANDYPSPHACIEQAQKCLETAKMVIIVDDSLFILSKAIIGKHLRIIKFRHCYFSWDEKFEEREVGYEAAFTKIFGSSPTTKKRSLVRMSSDVTEEQKLQHYAGLLYLFVHGGSNEEEEIGQYRPVIKYEMAVKDFEVLQSHGYMYPSRNASDNAQIIEPGYPAQGDMNTVAQQSMDNSLNDTVQDMGD